MYKKEGVVPPLRHELPKNWARIRDRNKFHANRTGVGSTFSDFLWVGEELHKKTLNLKIIMSKLKIFNNKHQKSHQLIQVCELASSLGFHHESALVLQVSLSMNKFTNKSTHPPTNRHKHIQITTIPSRKSAGKVCVRSGGKQSHK